MSQSFDAGGVTDGEHRDEGPTPGDVDAPRGLEGASATDANTNANADADASASARVDPDGIGPGRTVRFRLDACRDLDGVPPVLVEGTVVDHDDAAAPGSDDASSEGDGDADADADRESRERAAGWVAVDLTLPRGAFVVDPPEQPSDVTRHQVSTAKGLWLRLSPRVVVPRSAARPVEFD
jgi:hypothetical protein